jgi:hypothetical protein
MTDPFSADEPDGKMMVLGPFGLLAPWTAAKKI